MKLNARQVDAAKPREKAYKLADGAGLYLEVVPSGSRYWRMKYRFNGKEKRMAFGVYPAVSLAQARALRDEAKKKLAEGIDPSFAKKEEKLVRDVQLNNTFQAVALEWHGTKVSRWSEGYASDILEAFNKDIFPYIGQQPVNEIKPLLLLNVLRRMESRGATEKAKKVRQRCSEVFRYAIVTGRAEYNPAADLTSAMSGHESKHYPFLTVEELPDFFKALSGYTGSPLVVLAARLLILTGVRTGELRGAFWSEFDLEESGVGNSCRANEDETASPVPLSTQALEIVQQLKVMSGQYPLVFPGRNAPVKR